MILTPEEADLYYKLHWALSAHAARRLEIFPAAATVKDILALYTTERKMELRAAASVSQSTLHRPDATESHLKRLSSVRRALTKLENILYEDLDEM